MSAESTWRPESEWIVRVKTARGFYNIGFGSRRTADEYMKHIAESGTRPDIREAHLFEMLPVRRRGYRAPVGQEFGGPENG